MFQSIRKKSKSRNLKTSKKTSKNSKSKNIKKSKKSKKQSKKISKKTSKVLGSAPRTYIDKVYKHLDILDKYLEEKKLYSFYYFPDEKGFKNKLNGLNSDMLNEMMKKDINKYKNRSVANISICTNHKNPSGFSMKHGVLVTIKIILFQINDTGKLFQTNKNGTLVKWEEDDFKVSKITFKLIERLMRLMYSKKYNCCKESLGTKLLEIIDEIKNKKIPIEDVLEPIK